MRNQDGPARITWCECSDPGCPHCSGNHAHDRDAPATNHRLFRVDMEDRTGVAFCEACGEDALESGTFG